MNIANKIIKEYSHYTKFKPRKKITVTKNIVLTALELLPLKDKLMRFHACLERKPSTQICLQIRNSFNALYQGFIYSFLIILLILWKNILLLHFEKEINSKLQQQEV